MAAHLESVAHGHAPRSRQQHEWVIAFLATLFLFATSLIFLQPIWASNDDVAMSMVIDGHGLSAYASPAVVFSNILWGWLLYCVPSVGQIAGYSLVTMSGLLACCLTTIVALGRLNVPMPLAVIAAAVIIFPAMAAPQFTLLSGLLTTSGLLFLLPERQHRHSIALWVAPPLLMAGFLIRPHEFFLLIAIALPLLLRKALSNDVALLNLIGACVLFATVATILDTMYYQGIEWKAFNDLNLTRAVFSDFRPAKFFYEKPELLARHGFTMNDIYLLEEWFYVDPHIADAKRLQGLLGVLKGSEIVRANLNSGVRALAALLSPEVFFLTAGATVCVLFARARGRLICSALLLVGVLFLFGLLGRPAVLRIYYPALALLFMASLAIALAHGRGWPRLLIISTTLMWSCLTMLWEVVPANRSGAVRAETVRADLRRLDTDELYVVWGSAFPFEWAYPLLATDRTARALRFYAFGAFSLAPHVAAQWTHTPWPNFLSRLLEGPAVPMIMLPPYIGNLTTYCREHHARELRVARVQELQNFTVRFVSCAKT
jgi:hypothetical protein